MILSYDEIVQLIRDGVIEDAQESCVNSASLDLHLGKMIQFELNPIKGKLNRLVSVSNRTAPNMQPWSIEDEPYVLEPGEFILAHTIERFHLPLDISAQFQTKSSMGRIGLDHCMSGWCDAGWNNSVLTLELKNITQHHAIVLNYGDPIGQIIFHRHTAVAYSRSYAARGRYNGDNTVRGIKQ